MAATFYGVNLINIATFSPVAFLDIAMKAVQSLTRVRYSYCPNYTIYSRRRASSPLASPSGAASWAQPPPRPFAADVAELRATK